MLCGAIPIGANPDLRSCSVSEMKISGEGVMNLACSGFAGICQPARSYAVRNSTIRKPTSLAARIT